MANFRIFIDDEDSRTYDIQNALKLGIIYYNILLTDPGTRTVQGEKMKIPLSSELEAFINENKEKNHYSNLSSHDKEIYRMRKLQKAINDYLLEKFSREGNKIRAIEKNITMIEREIPPIDIKESIDNYGKSMIREKASIQEKLNFIAFLDTARDNTIELLPEGNGLFLLQIDPGSDTESIELQFSPAENGPVRISTSLCKINGIGKNLFFEYPNRWRQELFKSSVNFYSTAQKMEEEFINNTKEEANRIRKEHEELLKNNRNFDIIQLKMSIKGMHPPVWRRVLLPIDMTLGDLNLVIQAAFGWQNSAIYRFEDAYGKYSDLSRTENEFWFDEDNDSRETGLKDVLYEKRQKIKYEYYAKHMWELTLTVENMLKNNPLFVLPSCIDGRRNAPPENESSILFHDTIQIRDDQDKFDLRSTDSRIKNYKDLDNSDNMF